MRAVLGMLLIGGGLTVLWLDYTNHIGLGSVPLGGTSSTSQNNSTSSTGSQLPPQVQRLGMSSAGNGGGVAPL